MVDLEDRRNPSIHGKGLGDEARGTVGGRHEERRERVVDKVLGGHATEIVDDAVPHGTRRDEVRPVHVGGDVAEIHGADVEVLDVACPEPGMDTDKEFGAIHLSGSPSVDGMLTFMDHVLEEGDVQ